MTSTVLSSRGQVIIPKPIRDTHHWQPGQQLEVTAFKDGILLRPVQPFPISTLAEVAACLPYRGKAKTLAEMESHPPGRCSAMLQSGCLASRKARLQNILAWDHPQ